MFCHCFLRSEARKLAASWVLVKISARLHEHVPDSDVEAHDLLHLELDGSLELINLPCISSPLARRVGNFPALMVNQEDGDLLDHVIGSKEEIVTFGKLLTIFLFLFNFFKSSTDMWSTPIRSVCSQWAALPRTQHLRLGRGTVGRRNVPEKRLSRTGSQFFQSNLSG
jgi:hypothetical protein